MTKVEIKTFQYKLNQIQDRINDIEEGFPIRYNTELNDLRERIRAICSLMDLFDKIKYGTKIEGKFPVWCVWKE